VIIGSSSEHLEIFFKIARNQDGFQDPNLPDNKKIGPSIKEGKLVQTSELMLRL
jgi:hypothetical protein